MTAKEYLRSIQELDRSINAKQRVLDGLERDKGRLRSVCYDGARVQSSGHSDPTSVIDRIDKLQREINSDIARLKGARFVTSVEPNEGLRLNEGLIKQLTGDDVVTARKLYGEEFEFKPEFKLWMATNHKPTIRGTDTGIWRRIHLIPFTVQIPEEKVDRKLKDKLLQEAEGILAWCLRGLDMYNREGLKKPAAVINAIEAYRTEMDVISRFLDECTVPAPCRGVKAKELYNVYSQWCESNGEYKLTNTKFGVEITKHYEKKKNNSGLVYVGVDFSDDYRPYNISVKE